MRKIILKIDDIKKLTNAVSNLWGKKKIIELYYVSHLEKENTWREYGENSNSAIFVDFEILVPSAGMLIKL